MTIGILPFGRPTFDVEFANESLAALLKRLDETDHAFTGSRELLFDADTTRQAIAELKHENIDRLLVLQVTFTDAAMMVEAVRELDAPVSIWAIPEPRLGGRLRLNAFCGLNLAAHALGRNAREFSWAFGDANSLENKRLEDLLAGRTETAPLDVNSFPATPQGEAITERIKGKRIARIGEHPPGFDTCAYDPDEMDKLAGVSVDALSLGQLFDQARAVPLDAIASIRQRAEDELSGLDEVNQEELDRSYRLKSALSSVQESGAYDAFAIRCWPETFTEYGGAVCGPVAMMGEDRVPCACEADVYGALTQLVLQEVSRAPVFLTDIVDMDEADDTAVVWHCGQAPKSMCAATAQPEATIHTNRKMPLLYQFALKPGRVTLMRISQARGRKHMIIGAAEMLERPMAFTGTSGVLRFDKPISDVLPTMLNSAMEHHMAIAYGDHTEPLKQVAGAMGIPVLELA